MRPTELQVVSFNNEGYIDQNEMRELLNGREEVAILETDYKRYVGAQIGIYNPAGVKVGRISHLRNKEFLFVAGPLNSLKSVLSLLGENGPLFPPP